MESKKNTTDQESATQEGLEKTGPVILEDGPIIIKGGSVLVRYKRDSFTKTSDPNIDKHNLDVNLYKVEIQNPDETPLLTFEIPAQISKTCVVKVHYK